MNHEWVKIYKILAEELVAFYKKYKDDAGKKLYERCMNDKYKQDFVQWNPWIEKFEDWKVFSLDPLHLFVSFNNWKITNEVRKKKLHLYYKILTEKEFFELNNVDLDVFKYFPHIQITKVVGARDYDDQNKLWKFFVQVMENDIDGVLFDSILGYNNQKNVYGVGFPVLTIFMFWVNSAKFIPLDKNTSKVVKNLNNGLIHNKNWAEYSILINVDQNINFNENLFRNLTYLAIDFDAKYSKINEILSLEELKVLEGYFYYLRTGSFKQTLKDEIFESATIDEMSKIARLTNNFMLLGIKPLSECASKYVKRLEKEKTYHFSSVYTINDDSSITYKSDKDFDLYSEEQGIKINFQAIVGKNGLGKSTIIELVSMAIGNIALACDILEIDEKLENEIPNEFHNLAVELYFAMEGIYKVKCEKGDVHFYHYIEGEKENIYYPQTTPIGKNHYLKNIFYTIYSNYSLYALNSLDDGFKWLHPLFHKNDAYQTPIVIEPFRKDGSIDINKLNSLTKQRLISRILQPFVAADNQSNAFTRLIDDLTGHKDTTHLKIKVNLEKLEAIIRSKRDRADKFLNLAFEEALDSVLHSKDYSQIIATISDMCDIDISQIYAKRNSLETDISSDLKNPFFAENMVDTEWLYMKVALLYICNKIEKIAATYKEYSTYKNDFPHQEFIEKLLDDKTHITHKLHQAINFLKFKTVPGLGKIPVKVFSDIIERTQQNNPNIPTVRLIPPSFFTTDILLNNYISFNTLSSGEKQLIYTITSVIYHLQNLSSVHQSDNIEKVAYRYVNVILDEIELYFHPDYQRKFIYNLLRALENFSGLEDSEIEGLNFLLITHSPFILSDIVNDKILFLNDNTKDYSEIKTFGANIHELLATSFFMEDGLMGENAKKIIKDIIDFLNDKNTLFDGKKDYLYKLINYIGEDFLRAKLMDMYDAYYETEKDLVLKRLKQQQSKIQEQIAKLEQ